MRRFLRANSLSLVFGLLFLGALVGQAIAGHATFNDRQLAEGLEPISMGRYLTSASFAVDVAENWQSEYLQFFLFVLFTVWLIQKGSPESKKPEEVGLESDADQRVGKHARTDSPAWAKTPGGWRRILLSNSLGLVMGVLFLLSWLAQSVAGVVAFNEEQLANLEAPVSWPTYLVEPDFWNRTMQNWQSEFLAVASMAVLSIYLRQRGSPESKPVGASHASTGIEG